MAKYVVGDTIRCDDKDDLITTMTMLAKQDITTDFLYELNGVKGYWLIVEKV